MDELLGKGKNAKEAAIMLARLTSEEKNSTLRHAAKLLVDLQERILEANAADMQSAQEAGIQGALLDRLCITEKRIEDMAEGLREIAALDDPIGEVLSMKKRANGLMIGQKRVPIGVIGIIYEARPNVTADAFGLCLKTGNAVILRGGKEAIRSNIAIVQILQQALSESGLLKEAVQLVEDTSREVAKQMMGMNQYLDVLIPRGGAGLIQTVIQNSTVPVIETGVGNCHIYVDQDANLHMAEEIIINAKTHRPGVCNAAESLLIHEEVASQFVPRICNALVLNGVEVRGDAYIQTVFPAAKPATEEDWGMEYLDLIMAVKVVKSMEEAMKHIYTYGTKHSEAIITENYTNAQRFLDEIDAAAVYVNASTRFTDGYEFGFGAEIGISTQKLHARGPMGLKELTTTKYIIYGNGQIRK